MATPLTEQVYDALLNEIVQRNYKPGDCLPSETVLCEEFSVSRNTLRSALNKLSALGFVEARRGGGTYVKSVDSQVYVNFFIPALLTQDINLLEIMEFRKGMEIEVVRLAAQRITEEDEVELSKLLLEVEKVATNAKEFSKTNVGFHAMVAKASRNKMLEKMLDIVQHMILPDMQNFLNSQMSYVNSSFDHGMILRCILAKKSDEAALFMEKHMDAVIERVRSYVSNNYGSNVSGRNV